MNASAIRWLTDGEVPAFQICRYDECCCIMAVEARAIEMYARQAQNTEAERQACEIRLRAERKCGQLTDEMVTAQGHRSDLTLSDHPTKSEALSAVGISREQASHWERLAAIPAGDFEAGLADAMWRPTHAGARQATRQPAGPCNRTATRPGARTLALGATRVGLSASQVDAVPIPPR
jgi:hypothetical protein